MKLLGDVPEEHKALAKGLEDMLAFIESTPNMPKELMAKSFTCLAHDWFQIGVEEEGNSLLLKAEQVCPGYFKEIMLQQTVADSDFAYIVKSLSVELAWMLINKINDIKESK